MTGLQSSELLKSHRIFIFLDIMSTIEGNYKSRV